MTRNRLITIVVILALIAAVVAVVILRKAPAAPAAAEPDPTAVVTVATVRTQAVQDLVSVYGLVQADPAGTITIAAPRAITVTRVLVRSGESVAAGQRLVELANAPASDLAYRQATDALTFAQTDLARVQRLYDERLAASDQLGTARKVVADAQAALVAQQKQGGGQTTQTLSAPHAGIVTNVAAAAGDHVAQDAALLSMAQAGASVVKLGLEPSGRFAVGQAVTITQVFGGPSVQSRIAIVGKAADQTTKTLDATVPMKGAAWPIGAPVRGDVVIGGHAALVAPRAAVVFDETGPHVFTVAGGKAQRVFVKVGLDHGQDIEISGVAAGAVVAVEGAYELQDGMKVKVRAK